MALLAALFFEARGGIGHFQFFDAAYASIDIGLCMVNPLLRDLGMELTENPCVWFQTQKLLISSVCSAQPFPELVSPFLVTANPGQATIGLQD